MSFPITCTACNKTFTISDEIYEKKVAGRVVTIKCKSCSAGIRVDGTKGAAGASAAPAAPPAAVAPATAAPATAAPAATAPPVAAAPPPPPVPEEPLWAVDYGDGQDREFTAAEIIAELKRGAISGATLVWREGMEEWLELHQVGEFAAEHQKLEAKKKADEAAAEKAAAEKAAAERAAAEKAAAEKAAAEKAAAEKAAAAAAKAAPALVHKPRAPMPTVTGLGGPKAKAGSSPELGKPRVALGSSSDLGKPRAALGSSPELGKPRVALGSSPELATPRASAPSSPELPKPRATEPSGSDDLTPRPVQPAPKPAPPLAPPPPIAAPAVASAAPAAAPPAPPPPFAPPPAPIAAATLPLPAQAMEATPPLPASVAKVVSKPPQPQGFPSAPAAVPAAPLQSFSAPAIVADHATVEWPEAKSKKPLIIGALVLVAAAIGVGVLVLGSKDELPPPAAISALPPGPTSPGALPNSSPTSQPTGAAASQPGSDTASGSDPILARDSGATPGAGFAELFAAGARKAESSGSSIAPAGRFDAAATKAPLAEAATQAQACKQPGGPSGKVTVMVTFDPNGKVSSATINDAPFAGTPTATCIASALKRVSIPPFSGLPGTVSKTFSIL